MTSTTRAVGAYGERVALRHLIDAGMTPVARNWHCADGEIDLILSDGDELVFCEVKTRRSAAFGLPAEAVGRSKQRRLRRLACRWMAAAPGHGEHVRFDVVAVMPQRRGAASVEHLRSAF
ncbi:YraN family protein [Catenuloplanes sp. NPDC051500]|uniref:YraN family protein n=1 Tax=Catenuloplanes sp. NPDC051500 TaxID=3363959 RepID=UPI0037A2914A